MPAPSATAAHTSVHASTPTAQRAQPAPSRGRRRAPGRPSTAGSAGGAAGAGGTAAESAGDVVRWAVFCCVLVPVVLLVYGTSLGGAAGTALGLVVVTAVCRVLLRRSARGLRAEAAGRPARHAHGARHHRSDRPDLTDSAPNRPPSDRVRPGRT
ncbi:hypothetical protein ACF05T_18720 [Streptomyces lateritius]|uniref:Uncharacterized protein n=1 Tax=Streptomyces lateritius TaxID=67313 RepID=A0ABW6YEQ4_9ACTN